MDQQVCQECVAKNEELDELKEYVAFMQEQIKRLKKSVWELESIVFGKTKPAAK